MCCGDFQSKRNHKIAVVRVIRTRLQILSLKSIWLKIFIISNFANLPLWLVCQQFTKSNILHSFFFGKDFKVVCYYAVQRQKNAKLVLFCQTYFLGRSLALWCQLGWTNTNNTRSRQSDSASSHLSIRYGLFDVWRNSNNFGADIYLDVRSFVYCNVLSEFVTKTVWSYLLPPCKTGARDVCSIQIEHFL